MTTKTITLGNAQFEIAPLPLGRLKKAMPAVTNVAKAMHGASTYGHLNEEAFDHIADALSAALDMPKEQVENIVMTPEQAVEAVMVITEVCGLISKKGGSSGESQPGSSPATT